jgi:hypothetical protein
MKKITLREFQHRAGEYLDELPITLTRYGRDIAVVTYPDSEVKQTETSVLCKHGHPPQLCIYNECRKT